MIAYADAYIASAPVCSINRQCFSLRRRIDKRKTTEVGISCGSGWGSGNGIDSLRNVIQFNKDQFLVQLSNYGIGRVH